MDHNDFPQQQGVIRAAITAVPAVKWALGIAGVAAIAALVRAQFGGDLRMVIGSVGVIMLLSVLLVVFANVAARHKQTGKLDLPAVVLVWFVVITTMVCSSLSVSSFFFGEPIDWKPTPAEKEADPTDRSSSYPPLPTIVWDGGSHVENRHNTPSPTSPTQVDASLADLQHRNDEILTEKEPPPSTGSEKRESRRESSSNRRETLDLKNRARRKLEERGIPVERDSLFKYATIGDDATVNLLLDAGILVDEIDPGNGSTALMRAVSGCHESTSKLLVKRGASPHKIATGQSLLHTASGQGCLVLVQWLINDYKLEVDMADRSGRTSLMYAVSLSRPNKKLVEYLLDKGADLNKRGPYNWSVCEVACKYDCRANAGIIRLLSSKGASCCSPCE